MLDNDKDTLTTRIQYLNRKTPEQMKLTLRYLPGQNTCKTKFHVLFLNRLTKNVV